MPKITLIIEDETDPATGASRAKMLTQLDVGDHLITDRPTAALVLATTIQRLWQSQALIGLSRAVCPDILAPASPAPVPPAPALPAESKPSLRKVRKKPKRQ